MAIYAVGNQEMMGAAEIGRPEAGKGYARQRIAQEIPTGQPKVYVARVTNPVKRAGHLTRCSLTQIPPGHSPNPHLPRHHAEGNKK